ncbi:UbiD family decarboxylase [Chloroflexota bacterium]
MGDGLRRWLQRAKEMGLVREIDGADWDLEIAYLTFLNAEKKGSALLFDHIKGYSEGFRVLTCSLLSSGCMALTLGLPQGLSEKEYTQLLSQRFLQWEANLTKFAPRVVKEGPVLENIWKGKEIDLLRFPSPKWHEKDGGRYIGTGCAVITKDPETGAVNLGTYRIMLHDKNTVGIYITPANHGLRHIAKYHAKGRPAPVAVSLGHHPLIFAAASGKFPEGAEYSYAGAMGSEPIEVIEEEVTGLPIPADGEIVIAGWCPPGKTRKEAPFGEFTGYYGVERDSPVIEIERVYFRSKPVIVGSPPWRSCTESSYLNLMTNVMLERRLKGAGLTDIVAVHNQEIRGNYVLTVSIKQKYAGEAKQIGHYLASLSSGRYVIVVDEDINITDPLEVLWAIGTRSDPERDIDIARRVPANPLDPLVKKSLGAEFGSRAIIDACKPYEWREEFPEALELNPELVKQVTEKWGKALDS